MLFFCAKISAYQLSFFESRLNNDIFVYICGMFDKKNHKRRTLNTENTPQLLLIIAALQKDRNQQIAIGLVLLLISGTIALQNSMVLPFKTIILLMLFCLLLAFIGFYFLLHGILRYDTQRNHLLKLLIEEPDRVVCVYYTKIELLPFGIKFIEYSRLNIHLLNRSSIFLPLSEAEIKSLMPFLKQQFKRATFGHSIQNQQLYEIAPDLLQKEQQKK